MLERIPSAEDLLALLGPQPYSIWTELCAQIDELYTMEHLWNSGGKAWKYEYKYRRGGKTLCALYAKERSMGFLVILGKAEREKFELDRSGYSQQVQALYDEAHTYHDGKWILFPLEDTALFPDLMRLLALKRNPNRNERGRKPPVPPASASPAGTEESRGFSSP